MCIIIYKFIYILLFIWSFIAIFSLFLSFLTRFPERLLLKMAIFRLQCTCWIYFQIVFVKRQIRLLAFETFARNLPTIFRLSRWSKLVGLARPGCWNRKKISAITFSKLTQISIKMTKSRETFHKQKRPLQSWSRAHWACICLYFKLLGFTIIAWIFIDKKFFILIW